MMREFTCGAGRVDGSARTIAMEGHGDCQSACIFPADAERESEIIAPILNQVTLCSDFVTADLFRRCHL